MALFVGQIHVNYLLLLEKDFINILYFTYEKLLCLASNMEKCGTAV